VYSRITIGPTSARAPCNRLLQGVSQRASRQGSSWVQLVFDPVRQQGVADDHGL
jgi:hypothetical protein